MTTDREVVLGVVLLCTAGSLALTQDGRDATARACHIAWRQLTELPSDPPPGIRQKNWTGWTGGSCMNASWMTHLRWNGMPEVADWWGQHYSGRAGVQATARRCDQAGIKYACTEGQKDVEFLEWASRTRRGAVIYYFDDHAVNFLGYRDGRAWVLDNNDPRKYISIPKDEFLGNWCAYNSGAITVISSPPSPLGWTTKR